jgi:hypothetical protein
MHTIAEYARKLGENASIIDAHGRNGFIGSLLGREGAQVIGLNDPADKPNQIEQFADPEVYTASSQSLAQLEGPVDMLFSSWMPAGEDITPEITRLQPKLVVYIFTEHRNEETGERQTGIDGAFGENLPDSYKLIDEWRVTRKKDLLHEIWPDLTPNIEETRITRIYANQGLHDLKVDRTVQPANRYHWEDELAMAEVAQEAKREIMSQGFPVDF